MKGVSRLVSIILIILIVFFAALFLNYWTGSAMGQMLSTSFDKYERTVNAVVASFFNLFK
jgi:p-aminobenzoyl-glutamate transporter AbgT